MCTSTDATCSIGTSTYGIGTSLTLMVVLLTSSYCQQYDSCGHLIIIPDICHGSTGHTRGEKICHVEKFQILYMKHVEKAKIFPHLD